MIVPVTGAAVLARLIGKHMFPYPDYTIEGSSSLPIRDALERKFTIDSFPKFCYNQFNFIGNGTDCCRVVRVRRVPHRQVLADEEAALFYDRRT